MDAWQKFRALVPAGLAPTGLISANASVLLAVSGGADSISMAHMFWRLAKTVPLKLHIITFNHNLRRAAPKEVKLVEKFAEKFNIPFTAVSLDVKGYAKGQRVSIETAARVLRYEHLLTAAKTLKCNFVATAHNANDNAETALMWLIRGTGAVSGIPAERDLAKNIKLIRPLLAITRAEIDAYVKKNKLTYCTDKSNFESKFTRNKIRLKIMPEMQKINPSFTEQIYSFTKIVARENAFLESLTDKLFAKSVKILKNKLLLDLTSFFGYNEALRFRLLKRVMPAKNYTLHINEISRRILFSAKGVYRLDKHWSFEIRKTKGVFFKLKLRTLNEK